MIPEKYKVYILIDDTGRIIHCEGGYTMQNIEDISQWINIDEGEGDRYNLCQSHYFDGGLYTDDGIPRWKYREGVCVLRTAEEIEADRAAMPTTEAAPALAEMQARITELEAALDLLLSGATEG